MRIDILRLGSNPNTKLMDLYHHLWSLVTRRVPTLKDLAPGVWSRRLTDEHRIVYLVREDRIDFLQARYHYSK